jgi:hypothetical protein
MSASVRNRAERNAAESQDETRLGIFVRSLAEVIRQHPGISEKDLMELYTTRERAYAEKALLRVKTRRLAVCVEGGAFSRYYNPAFVST